MHALEQVVLGVRVGARTLRGMVARRVACLIAAGAAAKVVLAFATVGQQFDIDSLALVGAVLRSPERWHLYEIGARWPYPAGYFPLDYLAGSFAYRTGLPFHGTIQLWTIAADAAIAWLVQDELRRRGRRRARAPDRGRR